MHRSQYSRDVPERLDLQFPKWVIFEDILKPYNANGNRPKMTTLG